MRRWLRKTTGLPLVLAKGCNATVGQQAVMPTPHAHTMCCPCAVRCPAAFPRTCAHPLPAGQGVNSALEDVCVLEQQIFERHGGDLSQALLDFEEQRLPDSAALVKLVQVCTCVQHGCQGKGGGVGTPWCGVCGSVVAQHLCCCRQITLTYRTAAVSARLCR